jgi:SAM-dependent methyltransferase
MATPNNDHVACPLCQSSARLINARHPGWQRLSFFAIYGCQYCDLQFAWPLQSDSALYEHIYRQADILPGYDFYTGLAKIVERQHSPLDWLADQGPGYWFVRDALAEKLPDKNGRIVEIGSGLGYFTHALKTAGYDAVGLDLSATAVADATARFGNHYVSGDVRDYAAQHPGSAHAVVMIEVLEHLPSPSDMLTAISRLLAPGGFALITTPNKSVFLAEEYWKTDNPPVHLWWFSETAIRRMAQTSGFGVGFWNFSGYNRPGATPPP